MPHRSGRILLLNHEFPPNGGGAGKASMEFLHRIPDSVIMTMKDSNRKKKDGKIIEVLPIRTDPSHCGFLKTILFALTSFLRIVFMPRIERPKSIVAFFSLPSGLAALFAKFLFNIPYVVFLRGGDVPGFMPKSLGLCHTLLTPLIHLIWKKATVVAANGPYLKELAQKSYPGILVIDIPNGIQIPTYQIRPQSPLRVIVASRLVFEQKGLEYLPEIWEEIVTRFSHLNPELEIIGDGPAMDFLQEHLKGEKVVFHGWLPREEVIGHLQHCHLFLHLSIYEGVSNSLLEALASGNLVLVRKERANSWSHKADGVFTSLEDLNFYEFERLSLSNRKFVSEYDWDLSAKKILSLSIFNTSLK